MLAISIRCWALVLAFVLSAGCLDPAPMGGVMPGGAMPPGGGGGNNANPDSPGMGTPGGGGGSDGGGGGMPAQAPKLVVYWGQNGYGGANPSDPSKYEADLATTCSANPDYDVIVLAFATSFVRTRNTDGYPELNFANHCDTPWDARNPFLLRCDAIGAGIDSCQKAGKRVLLSLGGAAGSYGFASDAEGTTFAQTAWDVFLGGSSPARPFGTAVLDGVDLDLEGGSTTGYSAFVTKLRQLMSGGARHYYITGAPQCPFPDAYLGPAPGRPLGDVASAFDFLFVQFYNNYCSGASPAMFQDSFDHWATLAQNGGPKIYVGLPASSSAAASSSFVDRSALPSLIGQVKSSPAFGGVMLWDASFDQNSGAAGQTYGAFARGLL
jgi:chitinase